MTSAMLASRISMPVSKTRRRSPSVKIPMMFMSSSQIAVIPKFLRVISSSASRRVACRPTCGISSPVCIISLTRSNSLRPSAPPGCERAKSSAVKPRASSRATARASPITSAAVVLEVGASPNGQASFGTFTHRWISAARAMLLSGRLVMQISFTCWRFRTGISARISFDSPEFDNAITTSCGVTMPKSPCAASPGWTKNADVPVLAKVAAILRPIWPDLPIPITTTFPPQRKIVSQARVKSSFIY